MKKITFLFAAIFCMVFGVKAQGLQWLDLFDVQVVSCQGDRATNEVLLTLKVLTKSANSLAISSESGDFATDINGKRVGVRCLEKKYSKQVQLINGVPTIYKLIMYDVPEDIKQFATVSISYYCFYNNDNKNLGSNMGGVTPIVLQNIPITWSTLPTENQVCESFAQQRIFRAQVISCQGDKATKKVEFILGLTTESSDVRATLCQGTPIKAYDKQGKEYQGKTLKALRLRQRT